MESLDPTVLAAALNWTTRGLLGFAVFALIKGWLLPRGTVDRMLKMQDDRIKEAHERELIAIRIAETSEETRRDVADQLRTRQIVDEAVVKALSAPPLRASERLPNV